VTVEASVVLDELIVIAVEVLVTVAVDAEEMVSDVMDDSVETTV